MRFRGRKHLLFQFYAVILMQFENARFWCPLMLDPLDIFFSIRALNLYGFLLQKIRQIRPLPHRRNSCPDLTHRFVGGDWLWLVDFKGWCSRYTLDPYATVPLFLAAFADLLHPFERTSGRSGLGMHRNIHSK